MAKSLPNNGHLLKEINTITLISNTPHQDVALHFKTTSLCKVSYKIISKILASRLSLVLTKIISRLQSALIQNRIQDNILTAHEIMNKFLNEINRVMWKNHMINQSGLLF